MTAPDRQALTMAAREAHRIWFDTEFIEDGKAIDLISIGLVRDDGATYYAENGEADLSRADEWVRANVLTHLTGPRKTRNLIAREIVEFSGPSPEFWAYYADYDWVALCQLYGRMTDLPKGWPMFCRDLKQVTVERGNPKLPDQVGAEHNALADAQWNKLAWDHLAALAEAAPAEQMRPEAVAEIKRLEAGPREFTGTAEEALAFLAAPAGTGTQVGELIEKASAVAAAGNYDRDAILAMVGYIGQMATALETIARERDRLQAANTISDRIVGELNTEVMALEDTIAELRAQLEARLTTAGEENSK